MEYLNFIDFCSPSSSSSSIWLSITFLIMSLYCFVRLSKFIWGLRFKLVPQTSISSKTKTKTRRRANRKKNRAHKKPIPDVSVANDSHSEPEENLNTVVVEEDLNTTDVSVSNESHSQPEKDLKTEIDEPLIEFRNESLADATLYFDRLSVDGLGAVFKGQLMDTKEVLTIRELDEVSVLTPEEFVDQVLLLSQANHPNLAKLIGYSVQLYKRFLVYDNVSGGTLESHLYGHLKCLDWETRMNIVVGVAKALRYLHKMETPVLHCYIEPSNVWLDENYNPKLSAYGVVRLYARSYFSGSHHYTRHDYMLTKNITIETDIYGFGIFLLEIVTGRKGITVRETGGLEDLVDWVQPYLKDKEKLAEIVDSQLQGNFKKEELYEVCIIAEMCLEKQPGDRPSMADLVTKLCAVLSVEGY